MLFDIIKIEKNGSVIRKAAQRKKGILQTKIQLIDEKLLDINKMNLDIEGLKIMKDVYSSQLEIIKDSISFLEVIIDHLPDSSYPFSLLELNFLYNDFILSYK